MKRLYTFAILISCTLIFAGSGGWYIVSNPTNENPEAVWSAKGESDSSYEIRYSYLDGTDWAPSTALTSDAIDDYDPRLAFDSSGNRKVVWWSDEDNDKIKFSTLPASGGSWSTPETISDESEDCRLPALVVHSGTVYTSYQRIDASGRSVLASSEDSPDPWAADLIRSTQRTTDLRTRIHSSNGQLWVDWIDSDSYLGYSEHINGSWGSPGYESYSGDNDIGNGRQRIRQTIVEN
jgi:hypothetical protein